LPRVGDDIALHGRGKLAWLRTFLGLPNGIPSHDTFRWVFMLIGPGQRCVNGKSNEITAVPGLLDQLALGNSIVSPNALSGWPGLRAVLPVESIRSVNSAPTKVEGEIRTVLSSCPNSPAVLGQTIRFKAVRP